MVTYNSISHALFVFNMSVSRETLFFHFQETQDNVSLRNGKSFWRIFSRLFSQLSLTYWCHPFNKNFPPFLRCWHGSCYSPYSKRIRPFAVIACTCTIVSSSINIFFTTFLQVFYRMPKPSPLLLVIFKLLWKRHNNYWQLLTIYHCQNNFTLKGCFYFPICPVISRPVFPAIASASRKVVFQGN